MDPKGAESEPKGAKWNQMDPKGNQKGAKGEPKGDQNASKNRPSEKVAKSDPKWITAGEGLASILEPSSITNP